MNDMIQVAAFLKRRVPSIKKWSHGRGGRERLLMYLAWNTARYNACTVKDGDKIVAVGVARAISNEVDARFPYKSDETGKICYIEHTACTNNDAFKTLLQYVQKRWANCSKIMFSRSKNGSKNKVYDMQTFMRKAGC